MGLPQVWKRQVSILKDLYLWESAHGFLTFAVEDFTPSLMEIFTRI